MRGITYAEFIFIFNLSIMKSTNGFPSFFDAIHTATTEAEEVKAALDLAAYYETLLKDHASGIDYSNTTETYLEGGVALASQYALDCLKDPLRTTRFIAGTYQAIKDQLENSKTQKVNLLYAGCGPAAPLVLSFLHRFKPEELSLTLLDITESSLKAVKRLVKKLKLNAYVENYVLADAITYIHPNDQALDIVVSETMDKGLYREPQVRVMQNLASQLKASGVFIPQQIKLYCEHTFYAKEPYFDIDKDLQQLPELYPTEDRCHLFTIDKNVQEEPAFEYESEVINIPEPFEHVPDIAVFAEIQIYKERVLPKAKSLLSNSLCIGSIYNLATPAYKLKYSTVGTPDWKIVS